MGNNVPKELVHFFGSLQNLEEQATRCNESKDSYSKKILQEIEELGIETIKVFTQKNGSKVVILQLHNREVGND